MSRRLSAQSCPQVHRRDLSKNPTACGPCGQPSLLTTNTVAALKRRNSETETTRLSTRDEIETHGEFDIPAFLRKRSD